MTFILVVLFLFVIFPFIFKLILKLVAYSYKRKFTKFANQYTNSQQGGQNTQSHKHQRRRKIFNQNDGEYVNFEEIKEERTPTPADDGKKYADDRISDVKFEEIKD